MERSDEGELVPVSGGWFVVNVGEGRGVATEELGSAPNCMYHRENAQEGYLVLYGECILIVEEQERAMRQWDYAHLPAGTAHVCVGAGSGPCAARMVGTRPAEEELLYPVSPTAAKHGASVEQETPSGDEAYQRFPPPTRRPLPWPPG
jgi:uncharacterized cupin superfamily protein